MKCLIITAGKSSRLQPRGQSKPHTALLGVPLIEWVICSDLEAEVDEFYMVTGYQGERVRAFHRKTKQTSGN